MPYMMLPSGYSKPKAVVAKSSIESPQTRQLRLDAEAQRRAYQAVTADKEEQAQLVNSLVTRANTRMTSLTPARTAMPSPTGVTTIQHTLPVSPYNTDAIVRAMKNRAYNSARELASKLPDPYKTQFISYIAAEEAAARSSQYKPAISWGLTGIADQPLTSLLGLSILGFLVYNA